MNHLQQILELTRDYWLTHEIRRFATARLAWAVPTTEALEAIRDAADGRRIVEIGAGRGYWSHLLSEFGAEVRAFDTHGPRTDGNNYTEVEPIHRYRLPFQVSGRIASIVANLPEFFHPVESGGPDRAADGDLLFLCWPPMSDMARVAVECFEGDTIAYIGEDRGGCTADDDFHRVMCDDWREVRVVYIPTWPGIYDALTIYRRR